MKFLVTALPPIIRNTENVDHTTKTLEGSLLVYLAISAGSKLNGRLHEESKRLKRNYSTLPVRKLGGINRVQSSKFESACRNSELY